MGREVVYNIQCDIHSPCIDARRDCASVDVMEVRSSLIIRKGVGSNGF